MKLEDSILIISRRLKEMNELYGRPVFDEIAIVALTDSMPEVYYYQGPRGASFTTDFLDNSTSIRNEVHELSTRRESYGGELFFTDEGEGLHMDACICIGPPHVYLFCNNVRKSMLHIRSDPNWIKCQSKLFDISSAFSLNPFSMGAQAL